MLSRGMFFFERFLTADGRRPWNVILVTRLSGRIDGETLAGALSELQAHHPMLGAGIVLRGRRPHFVHPRPPPPIPVRIVERAGEAGWFDVVQAELERPFAGGHGPLVRVVWIRGPQVSELVLVADHCICDGRSTLLLMRELIEGLATQGALRPAQRFIETMEDLFPDPGRRRVRLGPFRHVAALGWILRSTAPLGRRLRRPGVVTPSYVLRWDLGEAECSTLSARCRTERVTAYAALATAFLRAVRAVRPRHSRNRLLCPVDVRARVPGLGPNTLFAFPATVALSIRPRLDHAFWSQARSLRHDLLARKARLDPQRTLLMGERMHGLLDWFVTLQMNGRARNDLMFSHLGQASLPFPGDGPSGLSVEAVLGFLSSMPWRGTPAIFSLRDGGVMRFFLVAREEALPRREAERIRADAMTRIMARIA